MSAVSVIRAAQPAAHAIRTDTGAVLLMNTGDDMRTAIGGGYTEFVMVSGTHDLSSPLQVLQITSAVDIRALNIRGATWDVPAGVTLASGANVTLRDLSINGPVTVEGGATLTMVRSRIAVAAENAAALTVTGGTVTLEESEIRCRDTGVAISMTGGELATRGTVSAQSIHSGGLAIGIAAAFGGDSTVVARGTLMLTGALEISGENAAGARTVLIDDLQVDTLEDDRPPVNLVMGGADPTATFRNNEINILKAVFTRDDSVSTDITVASAIYSSQTRAGNGGIGGAAVLDIAGGSGSFLNVGNCYMIGGEDALSHYTALTNITTGINSDQTIALPVVP
jgi:hypothetical protein